MQLPASFSDSLSNTTGFSRKAFEQVHESGKQVTSIRLNPRKAVDISRFPVLSERIPWAQDGYYLDPRPSFTFDPMFHAGCYYVQEASSMFLEQALKQTVDLSQSLKILDLSAAPGGKSTHIQSLISKDSLLVSNEVIRSRGNTLKDNLIKWGGSNVMITGNDPKDFTQLEGYFDVVVVDAPCSGSGLFRRDPEAMNEWSPSNVALCSQRQQRILADIWPALKKDGILVYSTCSYSKEEDEDIANWMLNELSASSCTLSISDFPGIIESSPGYRFWPDKVKGEGFYMAVFRKNDGRNMGGAKGKKKLEPLNRAQSSIIDTWVNKDGFDFLRHDATVYAWPSPLTDSFSFLLNHLRVIYSGTIIGDLLRDKLVPSHALAMSKVVGNSIKQVSLNLDDAIKYLQRKDFDMPDESRGWQVVNYEGQILGWINRLPNRINNYYPRELRILKDRQE